MTVKEAFLVGLGGLKVASGLVDRSLIQANLNEGDQYDPSSHDLSIEVATMNTLFAVLGTYKSISEGDMSVSFSDEMLKKLLFLAKKHGRDDIVEALDDKPKIKRVRKW